MERWPNWPPQVEVSMRWSLVWDWREAGQDAADPATWAWSANHALCLADAHLRNPLQPYQPDDLDLAGGWTDAADAAGEAVALAAGGTEARYEVHGVLVFNADELAGLLEPMFAAGAAQPLVIGGQTSIVPGVYQSPEVTVTDIVGAGYSWDRMQPGRETANTIEATYRHRDRAEESAQLPPYSVPGAVTADGGFPIRQRVDLAQWVPSPTQAARVQKIAAHRLRGQKKLSAELPPECFNVVAGAAVTLAFPAPHTRVNGVYQVESVNPVLIEIGEDGTGGVAMRLPVTLRQISQEWFEWTTADEPDIPEAEPISEMASVGAPASLTVTSSSRTSGGTTIVGALLEWPPSTQYVWRYETQYRETGGAWQGGPGVSPDIRDLDGDVFVFVAPLEAGEDYDFRVRAIMPGRISAWTEALAKTIGGPANTLSAPSDGSANANGQTEIIVQFTLPNEKGAKGISFYAGDSSDTGLMTLLSGPVYAAPNIAVSVTETGLSASQTRYYAARTVDEFDQESAFSDVVSATTDSGGP